MSFSEWLKARQGPLPGWGWLAGGAAGALAWWYFHRQSGAQPQTGTLYQQPPMDMSGLGGGIGDTTGGGTPAAPVVNPTIPVANPGLPGGPPAVQIQPPITPTATAPLGTTQLSSQDPNAPHYNGEPGGFNNDKIWWNTPSGWILLNTKPWSVGVRDSSGNVQAEQVSQRDMAWANTVGMMGLSGFTSVGLLDPGQAARTGDDAILTVPGSSAGVYFHDLAVQMGQAIQAQQQAAIDAANAQHGAVQMAPPPQQASPTYPVAQPQSSPPAPVYGPGNPNPNPPPGPPPAPPPIPNLGGSTNFFSGGGFNFNGVPQF